MSLDFQVRRSPSSQGATIGNLFYSTDTVVWERFCYTLEDIVREIPGIPVVSWKIKETTAIPFGKYSVVVSHSPHFDKDLPEILDVPGFTGVRIHGGNKASDTEGCLLVAHNLISEAYIQGTAIADVMQLLANHNNQATIEYVWANENKGE